LVIVCLSVLFTERIVINKLTISDSS
jgi:hypothetical protein